MIRIRDIITDELPSFATAVDMTARIAALIDAETQPAPIDSLSSYDSLIESFNKMDQALDEHFAVIDKLQAALNPAPVAEERIDV
jgi:hypothetical protein